MTPRSQGCKLSIPGDQAHPRRLAHAIWVQSQLTVWVVQHGPGDDGLQLLQFDLLSVPAAVPCLQGHLVDLLATSVAKTIVNIS